MINSKHTNMEQKNDIDLIPIDTVKGLKELINHLDDDTRVYIYGHVLDTVYPLWAAHTKVFCQEHNGKSHYKTGLILTTDDSLETHPI
jgi:hypothetical protein